MPSPDTQEQGAKKSPIGIIIILLLVLGGAVAIGLYNNKDKMKSDTPAEPTTEQSVEAAPVTQAESTEAPNTVIEGNTADAAPIELDIEALSKPRILGNPNAPVEISEHSSFTCGGCGAFHKGNFKMIKRDFIDTGKAYLVFDDFPHNKFDIQVGAIARCLPDESYFNYIQLMFETQAKVIEFLTRHRYAEFEGYATQNAMLAGGKNPQACMESVELHEALAARRKLATEEHGVDSTPTLVLNNSVVISGLLPYDNIKKAIEDELAKAAQ